MDFKQISLILAIASFLALVPHEAQAYIGPGAGLSAIGAFLALLAGGILVTIFGFVWYPVKRLRKKLRKKKESEASEEV